MKKESPSSQLVLITAIAIIFSVISIFLSATKSETTGLTTTDEGYVNVTVKPTVDIAMHVRAINFTSTFPEESRNSYESDDVDTVDGRPCTTDNYCGINISNEGSHFINITILLTEELFTSGGYDNTKYLLYNVTMQDLDYTDGYSGKGDCSTGYNNGLPGPDEYGAVGQWRAVPSQAGSNSSEVAICYLNRTDEPPDGDEEHRPDVAKVEINITVPSDEPEGNKGGALTFTASSAQ